MEKKHCGRYYYLMGQNVTSVYYILSTKRYWINFIVDFIVSKNRLGKSAPSPM